MSVILDPVHLTQRTFRALLAAMAHPGRVTPIEDAIDAPAYFGPALAVSALTLLDREVAVWIAPAQRAGAGAWLIAQTACRLVSEPHAAQFAVIFDPADALPLGRWNAGTPEDPEDSTTLLVRVDRCSGGPAVTLRGPGIDEAGRIGLRTVPPRLWHDWRTNAARFPIGVDAFFFDDCSVVGLARTTTPEPA